MGCGCVSLSLDARLSERREGVHGEVGAHFAGEVGARLVGRHADEVGGRGELGEFGEA